MKDGIVKLRQKGALLHRIRELIATVDVAVGTNTVALFLMEVIAEAITAAINETFPPPTRGHSDPKPPTNRGRPGNHGSVIIFTSAGTFGTRRSAT